MAFYHAKIHNETDTWKLFSTVISLLNPPPPPPPRQPTLIADIVAFLTDKVAAISHRFSDLPIQTLSSSLSHRFFLWATLNLLPLFLQSPLSQWMRCVWRHSSGSTLKSVVVSGDIIDGEVTFTDIYPLSANSDGMEIFLCLYYSSKEKNSQSKNAAGKQTKKGLKAKIKVLKFISLKDCLDCCRFFSHFKEMQVQRFCTSTFFVNHKVLLGTLSVTSFQVKIVTTKD